MLAQYIPLSSRTAVNKLPRSLTTVRDLMQTCARRPRSLDFARKLAPLGMTDGS